MNSDPFTVERMIEAMLFAAATPLALEDLTARLPADADVQDALDSLASRQAGRGVELAQVGGRWRLTTAPDLAHLMAPLCEPPPRLSRAAYETLAVIAYHQPATRSEIEEVRGVGLSRGTLDALLDLGWVRLRGRRRSPGRPVTYATTDAFLEHFGLPSLADLPSATDLRAAGVFDPVDAALRLPDPSRPVEDDDPLDPAEAGDPPEFSRDFLAAS